MIRQRVRPKRSSPGTRGRHGRLTGVIYVAQGDLDVELEYGGAFATKNKCSISPF